jgi:ferredoxin-type protein NapH
LESLLASRAGAPQVFFSLGIVLVVTLVIGKAFCAWVCPVPPLKNLLKPEKKPNRQSEPENSPDKAVKEIKSMLTDSLSPLLSVGGRRDGFLLDSRHLVLFGALASSLAFGFPVFCLICPVGLTFAVVVGIWQVIFVHEASWMLPVSVMLLLLELTVLRKWCHRFCPIGALLSLLSQRVLFRPHINAHQCLRAKGEDCQICVSSCPEEIDPHSSVIPECTKCALCIDSCPTKAIRMGLISEWPNRINRINRTGRL